MFQETLRSASRKTERPCFRVGSCWVFIANTFFSPHQQSVLLENGWGNPVETSCLATLTAGVVRKKVLSGRFRLRAYRTVQTRPVSSRSVHHGIFPDTYCLYPVPSAAAQMAPNGVKERASFCLVFRSLNTTSSHRMFSMGYRRAKYTQGSTNFQKRIFLANNFGITTRGP